VTIENTTIARLVPARSMNTPPSSNTNRAATLYALSSRPIWDCENPS
jgi:hypothetical protein